MSLLASIGEKLECGLRTAALWLALALILVLVGVCMWQVIARFVLLQSTPWTEAIARGAMLWAVFLALPAAFHHGAMVTLDLYRKLPENAHRWFTLVAGVASCVLLGLAVWYGMKMIGVVRFQKLAGVGISIGWIYAAVPVGCALAIPSAVRRMLEELSGASVRDDLETHL